MKEKDNAIQIRNIYMITGMVYVAENTWRRTNIYPTVYTNIKTATNVATRLKMMSNEERKEATGYDVDDISIRVEKVFVNNHVDDKINIIEAVKEQDDFVLETKGKSKIMTIDSSAWGKITVEFYYDSVKVITNTTSFVAYSSKSSRYCMRTNHSGGNYYFPCTDTQKRHLATVNEMLLLHYIEKQLFDKMGTNERYALPVDGIRNGYYWIKDNRVFNAYDMSVTDEVNLSDRFKAVFVQYV